MKLKVSFPTFRGAPNGSSVRRQSNLANVPLRQSLAVTGSVNQLGQVQAIGAVNEKIEGFFDICAARGLSGVQGVVIPGANVTVPTLEGAATVVVPPGTQPDAALRLKNKGLPGFDGAPHGDMYVRLAVRIPEKLSPDMQALFQQLRVLEASEVLSSGVHVGA